MLALPLKSFKHEPTALDSVSWVRVLNSNSPSLLPPLPSPHGQQSSAVWAGERFSHRISLLTLTGVWLYLLLLLMPRQSTYLLLTTQFFLSMDSLKRFSGALIISSHHQPCHCSTPWVSSHPQLRPSWVCSSVIFYSHANKEHILCLWASLTLNFRGNHGLTASSHGGLHTQGIFMNVGRSPPRSGVHRLSWTSGHKRDSWWHRQLGQMSKHFSSWLLNDEEAEESHYWSNVKTRGSL